ncbi:permease [Vibrio galatheae]|uniref:Permease n=1 Tax=Vibrio galatheae TaxID=579748 RepID=A0A0F4NG70_9VIBR|nr:MFS transporter [Vibrio galatheae]KJY82122.1 permease [Vibrio galatheae]
MSGTLNNRSQLAVISLAAALMGIGQNGLLVSLPFLVEQSAFDLPTWSILIAVGSFLFLPSAPFWGRYSDKFGPKKVVVQALVGMAFSFALLCLFAMYSAKGAQWTLIGLLGLVVARVVYGCTVSGMVPASQHWAILLCGEQHRLQAITAVSIGLSSGRLLGPLLSIVALKLSPFAPLVVMIVLPSIALIAALFLPAPKPNREQSQNKAPLPWLPQKELSPFLLTGLLLCASISLLQYSFSPLISSITHWSTAEISDAIGVLLTISAACTFAAQIVVVKNKKMTTQAMYRFGAISLVIGFGLFLIPSIWAFGVAMAIAAIGAALLVPAYTSSATETQSGSPGAVAGYISMSHTIGYGLASLLAFCATIDSRYPVYLCLLFSVLIFVTALSNCRQKKAQVLEQS